jgi:hypothetical protein
LSGWYVGFRKPYDFYPFIEVFMPTWTPTSPTQELSFPITFVNYFYSQNVCTACRVWTLVSSVNPTGLWLGGQCRCPYTSTPGHSAPSWQYIYRRLTNLHFLNLKLTSSTIL